MASKIYTIDEIKEKLIPIFRREPIWKAVIFGSYAKGCPRENSDLDIYIDTKGMVEGLHYFGILGDVVDAFDEKIQVDLIEAGSVVEGGRIQREIAESGVVIYMNDVNLVILQKMKGYGTSALEFVNGMDYESFEADTKTVAACAMFLSNIGELAGKLDKEFTVSNYQILWSKIKSLRNRIVHDYEGIRLDIVWLVLEKDIPELIAFIDEYQLQQNNQGQIDKC